jgi:probable HAF family extracellular repeat protein
MRLNIWATVIVVLVCAYLGQVVSLAAPTYHITDLGTLGGTFSQANGINNGGQVVGEGGTSGGDNHAFLYSAGCMQDLGALDLGLPGGAHSVASGINDNGQIVGTTGIGGSVSHAFLCSGSGPMQDLGSLYGPYSYASGINNDGQIVGRSHGPDSPTRAFLYSGSGPMQDLGTLGGSFSSARAINNLGQVAGEATISDGTHHAFRYSDGVMQDLNGFLQNLNPLVEASWAYAINDGGQVVGEAYISGGTSSGSTFAFLYSGSGLVQNLDTFGWYHSSALAINNNGQVVGKANNSSIYYDHAFLYSDGVTQDLNNLIDSASGWTLASATGINDNGWICGTGRNPSGETHAFLLTPVPEPSSLVIFATGGILFGGSACRRRRSHRRFP